MGRIAFPLGVVFCVLACRNALSAPEELSKRLHGKRIQTFDGVVKQGDPCDPTTQSAGTTYVGCRDTYSYFVEPIPARKKGDISGLSSRSPLKNKKVFHGLRIVYDEKGRIARIENYYAGVLHGQMIVYQDGEKWYEYTYKYGVGHGISRNYTRGGKLLTEMEVKDGKEVNFRNFKEDGRPDR